MWDFVTATYFGTNRKKNSSRYGFLGSKNLLIRSIRKRNRVLSDEELEEWAGTFNVLGNPARLAVVIVLYGNSLLFQEENLLSFGQINDIIQLPSKPALAAYLRQLVSAGVIEKHPFEDVNQRIYPVYSLSKKGKEFLSDFGLKELIEKRIAGLKSSNNL